MELFAACVYYTALSSEVMTPISGSSSGEPEKVQCACQAERLPALKNGIIPFVR